MAKGSHGWLRDAWACPSKKCKCKDNYEWRTACYVCGTPRPPMPDHRPPRPPGGVWGGGGQGHGKPRPLSDEEQREWLALDDDQFRALSGSLT
eukprot:4479868-Pyramimonas_sp.AAC.1